MPDRFRFMPERIEPTPIETERIDVSPANIANLQKELGRARILGAALEHMEEIGVDPNVASFDLSFGLKW